MFIVFAGVGLILVWIAVPPTMAFSVIPIAVLCFLSLILGHCLNLVLEKRRFHRTNFAGIQEFKSFKSAFMSNQLEGFLQLLSILLSFPGFVLMVAGVGAGCYLAFSQHTRSAVTISTRSWKRDDGVIMREDKMFGPDGSVTYDRTYPDPDQKLAGH